MAEKSQQSAKQLHYQRNDIELKYKGRTTNDKSIKYMKIDAKIYDLPRRIKEDPHLA